MNLEETKMIRFVTVLSISALVGLTINANANESHEKHWSYAGDTGPKHWAELNPEFKTCEAGKNQSPIDLKFKTPKKDRDIKFSYQVNPLKVIDNGHTIQVNFDKGSSVSIRGENYELLQMHFHTNSEHTFSGKHMPLEAHFVHKNKKGELAVVGVMFKEGKENPELQQIWSHLPSEKNVVTEAKVDFAAVKLIPTNKSHYHYMGSLTTPPCSEGVNWNVLNTPLEASGAQINAFRRLYSANNRPVQPVNDRSPSNFK
jgi:carbonic anhydrase